MCTLLRQATRALTRRYGETLKPAGINAMQFFQLLAISRLRTPTIGELASETELDRSTLGRNIRVLEKMKLVRFGPGGDERTRVVRITKKGKEALEIAVPLWKRVQAETASKLGADRRAELLDVLNALKTEAP